MEEADLVKERLQAITDKRKVQEDIAHKKLEIDKEKLKLQHLKKKSLRELWLMDGAAIQSPQQRETLRGDQQQTKLLQTNIHRIEKEIEALEREETMISKNEAFILKRLKAIEKTPEEIIKEANENFKEEPIHIAPATLGVPKSYKTQISRKQSFTFNKDTPKQTMFAMEINVQKDLRTGESRVLSTSTVTPQELQRRGIKVYDDGRKSVYALQSDGSHLGDGSNGVDELSHMEVEELLRAATEQKKSQSGPLGHQGHQEPVPEFSPNCGPRVHQDPVPAFSPNCGSRIHQEPVPAFSPNCGSRIHQEPVPAISTPSGPRVHQEPVPAFSTPCGPRVHQEPVPAFSPNCGTRVHQEPVPAFSTPCSPRVHQEPVHAFPTPFGRRGHQELSPMEVEELLQKATVQKMPQSGAFPRDHQVHQESVPAFSTTSGRRASASNRPQQSHDKVLQGTNGNGYQYEHDVLSRKELHYNDEVHYSGPESLPSSPHIPVRSFISRKDEEYYQPTNGYIQNPFSYGGEFHPTHNSYHSPRENQQGRMFYNSSAKKELKPSPIYQEDSHFSILNAIDTSEPITAIFMGYQTAEDDSGRGLGYEGSIRAELVIIGDEDGVDESNPQLNTYNPDGYNKWGYHHSHPQQKVIQYMAEPTANCNANNASPYTASKKLVYPGQQAKEAHYPYSDVQFVENGTERYSAPASRTCVEKPEQFV